MTAPKKPRPPQPAHARGDVLRHPVEHASGETHHQLVIVTGHDANGNVRGIPLGYEHEAASFAPEDLVGYDEDGGGDGNEP